MDVKEYMNEHRERMLEELLELLRIPSISADPAYAEDTHHCAEVVADHLRKAGADNVEVVPTKGYPVVYGEKLVDPAKSVIRSKRQLYAMAKHESWMPAVTTKAKPK